MSKMGMLVRATIAVTLELVGTGSGLWYLLLHDRRRR